MSTANPGRAEAVDYKYDLFISYGHNYLSAYADALFERLGDYNYRCFLDRVYLGGGNIDGLDGKLSRAIDESHAFILLVDPRSARSEWVSYEVHHILDILDRDGPERRRLTVVTFNLKRPSGYPDLRLRGLRLRKACNQEYESSVGRQLHLTTLVDHPGSIVYLEDDGNPMFERLNGPSPEIVEAIHEGCAELGMVGDSVQAADRRAWRIMLGKERAPRRRKPFWLRFVQWTAEEVIINSVFLAILYFLARCLSWLNVLPMSQGRSLRYAVVAWALLGPVSRLVRWLY
jgi:hypothetical protein